MSRQQAGPPSHPAVDAPMDEEVDHPYVAEPPVDEPPCTNVEWEEAPCIGRDPTDTLETVANDRKRRAGGGDDPGSAASVIEARVVHEAIEPRVTRRRLSTKTPGSFTVYAEGDAREDTQDSGVFLTRREARAEANRLATKRRRVESEAGVAADAAWKHLERNPGIICAATAVHPVRHGGQEAALGPTFHPSHDITISRGDGVVYCRVCAAWSTGRKARKLKVACAGTCNQLSLLRRLELGVAPSSGE